MGLKYIFTLFSGGAKSQNSTSIISTKLFKDRVSYLQILYPLDFNPGVTGWMEMQLKCIGRNDIVNEIASMKLQKKTVRIYSVLYLEASELELGPLGWIPIRLQFSSDATQ